MPREQMLTGAIDPSAARDGEEASYAGRGLPGSASAESLAEVIMRAKEDIARVAGTDPSNVRVIVEI